jgi:ribonuclease HI/ADP-ribose pyrophosphatase YjhB (NUDIX family)
MDILPLLDELRTIALNGLNYTENPYDRERYERLLALAGQYYGQAVNLPPEEARQRLAAELGYVTPKVGADGAIFNDDGWILLVRRADDGRWCLPCGWVDPNETPAQAAVREVKEETGLESRVVQLVNVFSRLPNAGYGPHSAVAIVYLCEVTGGTLQISHESVDARYWRIEEVPAWYEMHLYYAQAAYACWQAWRSREKDDLEGEAEENLTGERKRVKIYTDGSCKGQPGPGGYAAVILTGHQREVISGGFRLTNNGRMELMAAVRALKKLRQPSIVRLYTDSLMIVKAMQEGMAARWRAHGWKRGGGEPINDADLWERLLDLCQKHEVTFTWVKGHAGNPENQLCDRLSARAARGHRLSIDVGYESTVIQRLGLDELGGFDEDEEDEEDYDEEDDELAE